MLAKALIASGKMGRLFRWRLLGAGWVSKDLATLENLGATARQLVSEYNAVYVQLVHGTATQTAESLWKSKRLKLGDLIKHLGTQDAEACARALYVRDRAVFGRLGGMGPDLAEIVRSERAVRIANELQDIQHAQTILGKAAGAVASLGRGKVFATALAKFIRVLPLHDADLIGVARYVITHAKSIRAAWATRAHNSQAFQGHLSKVKSLLFEAYVGFSRVWARRMVAVLRAAEKEAARLGPEWKATRVKGGLRYMNGRETWDEAILLIQIDASGTHTKAIVFATAQIKAEKDISVIHQILKDVLRETDSLRQGDSILRGGGSTLPNILQYEHHSVAQAVELLPHPIGRPITRFVAHTAGARIPESQLKSLAQRGMAADVLELEISVEELNKLAEAFIQAILTFVP